MKLLNAAKLLPNIWRGLAEQARLVRYPSRPMKIWPASPNWLKWACNKNAKKRTSYNETKKKNSTQGDEFPATRRYKNGERSDRHQTPSASLRQMAGRHGNKGVVTAHSASGRHAWHMADGRPVDIKTEPIKRNPSRKNIGQMNEAHLPSVLPALHRLYAERANAKQASCASSEQTYTTAVQERRFDSLTDEEIIELASNLRSVGICFFLYSTVRRVWNPRMLNLAYQRRSWGWEPLQRQ